MNLLLDKGTTEYTNISFSKYIALKDYILKSKLPRKYSIIGICDQTSSYKLDNTDYNFLANLSKDICTTGIIESAILFRNSDSLIAFSQSTIKILFKRFDPDTLYKNVDVNGRQVVLFIYDNDCERSGESVSSKNT